MAKSFKKELQFDNKTLHDMFDLEDSQQIMEMELKYDQEQGEWKLIADIFEKEVTNGK
jgi:hypothetical protein